MVHLPGHLQHRRHFAHSLYPVLSEDGTAAAGGSQLNTGVFIHEKKRVAVSPAGFAVRGLLICSWSLRPRNCRSGSRCILMPVAVVIIWSIVFVQRFAKVP